MPASDRESVIGKSRMKVFFINLLKDFLLFCLRGTFKFILNELNRTNSSIIHFDAMTLFYRFVEIPKVIHMNG